MKFVDPRIDFAFKKIFGSEDAKDILISFLESLLGLRGDRCIAELAIMDPFLVPRLKDLKSTILDVRCKDHRGISYIVEMQVEKVAAFLKRIQFNSAKAYANQISRGEDYPHLKQIIAVTITDFILFEGFEHCASVHESRKTVFGQSHLTDIVHHFVELPKFTKDLNSCDGIFDQWLYFIKYASTLEEIPEKMQAAPIRHAFEKARVANMTADELELYDKAGIAIADARGRLELAREEGREEGERIGVQRGERKEAAKMLTRQLQRRFGSVPDWANEKIAKADQSSLEEWSLRIFDTRSLDDVFSHSM
ncbi:MAG: Rpn family recombination-promoting nuclease/putative transposase [Magnetococcales bacterium]|nr:Rpn family recombination-promoting nuclease/putative transposase [Magnetococcales bacterium]